MSIHSTSSRIPSLLVLTGILSSLLMVPIHGFNKGDVVKIVASHAGPVNNRKY